MTSFQRQSGLMLLTFNNVSHTVHYYKTLHDFSISLSMLSFICFNVFLFSSVWHSVNQTSGTFPLLWCVSKKIGQCTKSLYKVIVSHNNVSHHHSSRVKHGGGWKQLNMFLFSMLNLLE